MLAGQAVLAHEKWFTDDAPSTDWGFFLSGRTLGLVGAAVLLALAWVLVDRRLHRPEIPPLALLGRLGRWVPRLLAIHAGVSLLAQASRGSYLAPSLRLPDSWFGTALAVVEGLVGVWLISGYRIRVGAALLVAAGPLGMVAYGVIPLLERADLLGIALFLAILPPGEDAGGAASVDPKVVVGAVFALRILVGTALIVVAFTEKLANPDLARGFLAQYPAFDLFDALGLGSTDSFVAVAGAVEVLFGLLIISGAAPQAAVLLAGIPFNATLFFLGTSELIGHLPIYGAMLALLVYGSNPGTADAVRGRLSRGRDPTALPNPRPDPWPHQRT